MRGIDIEQVRQELSNYSVDPEWAALSFEEKMDRDTHRYFLEARVTCHEEATAQILAERDTQEENARTRQSLAASALTLIKGAHHTPRHRA